MITGVAVEGLFGAFDHSVELNVHEGVTILAAPNGYGKSTLLHMIKAVDEAAFADLAQVPFERFSLSDDNGPTLVFSRRPAEISGPGSDDAKHLLASLAGASRSWSDASLAELARSRSGIELVVSCEGVVSDPVSLGVFPVLEAETQDAAGGALLEAAPCDGAGKLEFNRWLSMGRRWPAPEHPAGLPEYPAWLQERIAQIRVLLIESQRLLVPEPHGLSGARGDGSPASIPAVTAIDQDLVRRIKNDRLAYVTRSGEIDRTFPLRFLTRAGKGELQSQSVAQLRARLRELDDKRAALQAVGILEREELPALEIPDDISDAYLQAVSLLVGDIEDKLSHFDDLESRIALLKELANARFQFKTLEIDAERGLYCVSGGREIPLTRLSSGEQHELVLFYEALFQAEEGSLLMIDEPELSLHAAWQSAFIGDLRRILALSGGAVLIATHSSALIGGHWDLVVELTRSRDGLQS